MRAAFLFLTNRFYYFLYIILESFKLNRKFARAYSKTAGTQHYSLLLEVACNNPDGVLVGK